MPYALISLTEAGMGVLGVFMLEVLGVTLYSLRSESEALFPDVSAANFAA